MFKQVNMTTNKGAKEAIHVEMERLIVIIDVTKVLVYNDLRVKLLMDFPDDCLLFRFSLFDLSSWELPSALEFAIASLRCKDLSISFNDGGDYMDALHDDSFLAMLTGGLTRSRGCGLRANVPMLRVRFVWIAVGFG